MLDRILQRKREEVEALKRTVPVRELRAVIPDLPSPLDFKKVVARAPGERIRIIAEVKKASPSAGRLREVFRPGELAGAYERGGASAISVLTDGPFFGGSLEHLTEIRRVVSLPLLRKDFIVDPYQVFETRARSADAILLIVKAVEPSLFRDLFNLTLDLELHPLVEVHTEEELRLALEAGADLIGINNRELTTFQVSLETTFTLLPLIPEERVVISESGIRSREELLRLSEAGLDAVLIGEVLMRAADPASKLRELLGDDPG